MADDKPFDAVRLMRELRDRMSREFAGMTFEEQKRRMDEVLGKGDPPVGGGMSESRTEVPAEAKYRKEHPAPASGAAQKRA
jgi:hypothetical protein